MNTKIVLSNNSEDSIIDERIEEPVNELFINLKTDKINEKCLNCLEKCKQSFKVTVVVCPNYNPKKGVKNGFKSNSKIK